MSVFKAYMCVCMHVSVVFRCIDCVYRVVDSSEFIDRSFVEAVSGGLVISSSEEML